MKKHKAELEESDRLHKEIRELKSIIRSLKKRLKKVDRGYKEENDVEQEEDREDDLESIPRAKKCERCSKGNIIKVDILGRKFERCENNCGYRRKI